MTETTGFLFCRNCIILSQKPEDLLYGESLWTFSGFDFDDDNQEKDFDEAKKK